MKFFRICLFIVAILNIPCQTFAVNVRINKVKLPNNSIVQSMIVVNAKNGKIFYADNARSRLHPASLTKLMTLYLLFKKIDMGKWTFSKKLYVSSNATNAIPSKLHLKQGSYITVEEAAKALIVKSANDVAVVVGENIAGAEKTFARLMNVTARRLGMYDTKFANASGLHDDTQYTTAVDLAKLAIAIKRDFPGYYKLFSEKTFVYDNKKYNTTNALVVNYEGAEGLKTGFTTKSGYNLITAVTRGKCNLIAVITGAPSSQVRDKNMQNILDQQFARLKSDARKCL